MQNFISEGKSYIKISNATEQMIDCFHWVYQWKAILLDIRNHNAVCWRKLDVQKWSQRKWTTFIKTWLWEKYNEKKIKIGKEESRKTTVVCYVLQNWKDKYKGEGK